MPILFCNIGWMQHYDGLKGTNDEIINGGKHVTQYKSGHEVCNFVPCGNYVYGYVESIRGTTDTQISIERLGADPHSEFVTGVDVIWTATSPTEKGRRVVGWFRNAKVYRNRQKFKKPPTLQHRRDGITDYRIKAKISDAELLAPQDRDLVMPKGKGWMGEKAWWYADSDHSDVSSFLEVVQDLIEGNPALQIPAEEIQPPSSFEGTKKSIIVNVYERDPSARRVCINHWGAKCTVCGFNFELAYGEIGKGFIHVHHLVPLASIGKRYKIDPIKELRPICPNCHSMIHRERKKTLTIEALRKVLKR